ncbi:F-box protein At2g26850 isoform X1 [Selaginella moellendorffii]|uniref:F-box protein At2g26850 isoform X1 n=1 Tax=Selaginella moellendorffii TaxID=88036 RepID=UPI000D1C6AF6|nr:F-box protein At2g26850 isoform X1 [Selaginella moellendorffii]|eukprot:XP_024528392.1 F-box protein At2g26850 isoform X1 [Selaginella moellendorffii]
MTILWNWLFVEFLLELVQGRVLVMFSRRCVKKVENVEDSRQLGFLDLPELVMEGILTRLPAVALCQMAGVCRELRKKCRSNHLWEALVYEKWGKVTGRLAFAEWQLGLAAREECGSEPCSRSSGIWLWPLSCILPVSWMNPQAQRRSKAAVGENSLMAWYWDLETGRFRFPAQVYNRENGHVGFMLSCYDAEVSYNSATDVFLASFSYPPHGPRTSVYEEDVPWERVRAPPVDTAAHELHASDCLHDLRPGDHIEVQWRRNRDFPYGWWYGIVGHTDLCPRNHQCQCHLHEIVWLEFNQYTLGSRWRKAPINRANHCEEGNEGEGFYGGVRKLRTKEEISIWTKLWPSEKLE